MDILPAWQRRAYRTLAWTREQGLVLYGGTAVALYLGHRESKDFDSFSNRPLNKALIIEATEKAGWKVEIIQNEPQAPTCLTDPGAGRIRGLTLLPAAYTTLAICSKYENQDLCHPFLGPARRIGQDNA